MRYRKFAPLGKTILAGNCHAGSSIAIFEIMKLVILVKFTYKLF
jgi:hypothetical protein